MKPTQYIYRRPFGIIVSVPYFEKGERRLKTKLLRNDDFVNKADMFPEAVFWRDVFVDRYGRSYQQAMKTPVKGDHVLHRDYGLGAHVQTYNGRPRIRIGLALNDPKGGRKNIWLTTNRQNVRAKIEAIMVAIHCVRQEAPKLNPKDVEHAHRRFFTWAARTQNEATLDDTATRAREGMMSWLLPEEKHELYHEHDIQSLNISEKAFMWLDDRTVRYCVDYVQVKA